MRKTMSMVFVALAMLAAPMAAQAKPYYSEGAKKSSSMTGYSYKKSYKGKYASKKGKYASKKGKRRYSGGGGGSASTGCLTSQARALLGRIQSQFGNVQIISTCRPGARIATTGKMSKHASGQAIDFRVPGRKAEVIAWLRQNHNSGGTMTYSDMDHIHVDVGARFVALNRPSGRRG
jgi:hypothetical protein